MVARRNLHPTDTETLRTLAATAAAPGRNQRTGPAGTIDLGNTGELAWRDPAGTRHSIRDLPGHLTQGLSTAGRMNTVASTPPPAAVDGYPDRAIWTQIDVRDGKRVIAGVWQNTSGSWQPVAEDASRLITGSIDVGLLDAALLGARLIEAGTLITPAGSDGHRARIDAGGLWIERQTPEGYTETLAHLGPDGDDYLRIGQTAVTQDGIATPTLDAATINLAGVPVRQAIRDTPRIAGYAYRRHNTNWRRGITRLLETSLDLQPGRLYRVEASGVNGTIDRSVQDWARMNTQIRALKNSPPLAVIQDFPVIAYSGCWVQGAQDPRFSTPPVWAVIDTRTETSPARWNIVLTLFDGSPAGRARYSAWGNVDTHITLTVRDEGIPGDLPGWWWQDEPDHSGGGATGATTTTTTIEPAATAASYWASGPRDEQYPNTAVTGTWNGTASTVREGVFCFGDMRAQTAGTVGWARFSAYCAHTYNSTGVDVELWALPNTTLPATRPTAPLFIGRIHGWRAGVWGGHDLPPHVAAAIRAGEVNSILVTAGGNLATSGFGRFTDGRLKVTFTH